MVMRATHPSPEALSAFSLGQLPPEEAASVESHINDCQSCCETMLGFSDEDTFVGLIKDAGKATDESAPAEQTIDHASGTNNASSQPAEVPDHLASHPRYEIVELIGKGGMGDVYKARHRMMDRTVALKVINRDLFRKREAVSRFQREVKAAAQLSHANIVTSHDADQAGDFHFMVMEYVDGVDLSEIVKERGALPIREACDYVRQAAIGLQHAHERGMVHRDVKPHNLMLTSEGDVKILDFGLASLAPEKVVGEDVPATGGDLTMAGAIMGTPDFISPEQATDARQADIRSDIYSLGSTLYFLLSGQAPFAGGSVMHKLQSHAELEPESLKSLRDDVPAELEEVIAKMMAKNPEDRFQTPAEVAKALQDLGSESTQAKPQAKPARQKSRVLPLTAVAAMIAAAFAGIVFYMQTDNGVVRVEVESDSLEVEISGQTITVKNDDKPLEIKAGDNTLTIRQVDTGYTFKTKKFTLSRNENVVFNVELLNGDIIVQKNGDAFDRSQSQKLVGEWLAKGPGDDEFHLTFNPDGTFGMVYFGSADLIEFSATGTYAADFSVSPAHLDLDATFDETPSAGIVSKDDTPPLDEDDAAAAVGPGHGKFGEDDLAAPAYETDVLESGPRKHKFALIIKMVDANSILMSDLEADTRPKTFGVRSMVMHRQGVEPGDGTRNGAWGESLRDQQRIQGTWKAVAGVTDGSALTDEEIESMEAVYRFAGDRLTITHSITEENQEAVKSFRLNPRTNPKQIDTITEDGNVVYGIYEFRGDSLRICRAVRPRRERPATFEAKEGMKTSLLTLKRVSQTGTSEPFGYDLAQVPGDAREIYGFRPGEIKSDARFDKLWNALQSSPLAPMVDENLAEVVFFKQPFKDGTLRRPVCIMTVANGDAKAFAFKSLSEDSKIPVDIGGWTYFPAKLPEQFFRIVDNDTILMGSRQSLDNHAMALKATSNAELLQIAATIPDGPLFVIGNSRDKRFLEVLKSQSGKHPIATIAMSHIPLWQDTSYLTASLSLGDNPQLHCSAHALTADKQPTISQTMKVLPVSLANLLRSATSIGESIMDASAANAVIDALNRAKVSEPSATETRVTVSLTDAEPQLFEMLDAYFDVERAKIGAVKAMSVSNLRQIAMAFLFFEQEHGYLPSVTTKLPGAKHPVSWRVAILKYLDEDLYEQYKLDEPWYSEHNKSLIAKMPSFYRHPGQEKGINNACYVTLVGEKTATGNGQTPITASDPTQTILAIEAYTNIPWTKPEDHLVEDDAILPDRRPHRDGWNAVFVDGSAHFISSETAPDVLKALTTRTSKSRFENNRGVWKAIGDSGNDVNQGAQSTGGDNAALVYWQAFALLPELSGEDTKLLNNLTNGGELGDDAKSLLKRSKTAFGMIAHLQPNTPCRWELIEDGPSTLLPHLSKARTLAQLLVLQARVDAESGEMEAAIDRLAQAFLVARNVDDGVLVQMIVGDTMESLAANVALSIVPKLDAPRRDRFAKALSKLPPRATFTQALHHERDVFGRGAGKMMSDALEQLGQDEDSPVVRAVLAATEKKQAIWIEELVAEYDKAIEASELPLAAANKRFAQIEAQVPDSSNPLIKLMIPSLVGTNEMHAKVDARMEELETKLRDAGTSANPTVELKPTVQLHFVEPHVIDGVTERTGIKFGEGVDAPYVYLHTEPAIVLKPENVVSVAKNDFSFAGKQLYAFDVHLTNDTRKKIAKVVEGKGKHMRHVTFVVDGRRCGGMQRYEVDLADPRGIPEACRATSFYAMFNGSTDKQLVKRIIDALEGNEPPQAPDEVDVNTPPVIELRWAVSEHVPGFTNPKNRGDYLGDTFYSSEPALKLTAQNVASASYHSGSPPPSGGILFHHAHIKLTDEALAALDTEIRKILKDEDKREKVRYLTLLVDGAEGFSATLRPGKTGNIGWNSPSWRSAEKAQRVIDALTAKDSPTEDSTNANRVPQIDFRWVVTEHVPGVTDPEDLGWESGVSYAHLKPTLTREHIANAEHVQFEGGGLGLQHSVNFQLNEKGIAILEGAVKGMKKGEFKMLATFVDGEYAATRVVRPGLIGNHPFATGNSKSDKQALRIVNSFKSPADATSPRELDSLSARISHVQWSDDGTMVAAVDKAGNLRVFHAVMGEEMVTRQLGGGKNAGRVLALSRDLIKVATISGDRIQVRHIFRDVLLAEFEPPIDPRAKGNLLPAIANLAFSPDGSKLLVGSSPVSVWDIESGKIVHKQDKLPWTACSVAWSDDGTKYAARTEGYSGDIEEDANLKVWETESGNELSSFDVKPVTQTNQWYPTACIVFSPDGEFIANVSGRRYSPNIKATTGEVHLRLWELENNVPMRPFPGVEGAVGDLRFTPNFKIIAMQSADRVRLWNIRSGNELQSITDARWITDYDFDPSGKFVLTGHKDGSVAIRNLKAE